jgi:hypothetical protein
MNPLLAGKFAGAFQPGAAGTGFDFESFITQLPKTEQDKLRVERAQSEMRADETRRALAPFYQQPYTLEELGKFREQEARRAQELGKESVETAFKYGMLANIPKAITQASTAAALMKLAAGESAQRGGQNILNAYANMQLPSSPMYQSREYFG